MDSSGHLLWFEINSFSVNNFIFRVIYLILLNILWRFSLICSFLSS